VIVRWATDRWAVVFSASGASRKQWGRTRIGKTKTPYVLGVLVLLMRVPLPQSASTPTQPPGSRLSTLRLPTRLGVPSKLIRFPNALRRVGCLVIPHKFDAKRRGTGTRASCLVIAHIFFENTNHTKNTE
jgi:hypothetical protein